MALTPREWPKGTRATHKSRKVDWGRMNKFRAETEDS